MFSSEFKKFAISLILGLLSGAGVTTVALALFSLIYTKFDLSNTSALIFTLISLFLGSFISGFVAAKINNKNGLIIGVITGVILFIIITLISMIFSKGTFTIMTLYKLIIILLSATIGGVAGVNIRKSNKLKI